MDIQEKLAQNFEQRRMIDKVLTTSSRIAPTSSSYINQALTGVNVALKKFETRFPELRSKVESNLEKNTQILLAIKEQFERDGILPEASIRKFQETITTIRNDLAEAVAVQNIQLESKLKKGETTVDFGPQETKRDETKRDETKRDETKRDETKRDETKRDETKRDETKRDETKVREEQERKVREEQERKVREEQERKVREEEARKVKEEQEKIKKQKEQAERTEKNKNIINNVTDSILGKRSKSSVEFKTSQSIDEVFSKGLYSKADQTLGGMGPTLGGMGPTLGGMGPTLGGMGPSTQRDFDFSYLNKPFGFDNLAKGIFSGLGINDRTSGARGGFFSGRDVREKREKKETKIEQEINVTDPKIKKKVDIPIDDLVVVEIVKKNKPVAYPVIPTPIDDGKKYPVSVIDGGKDDGGDKKYPVSVVTGGGGGDDGGGGGGGGGEGEEEKKPRPSPADLPSYLLLASIAAIVNKVSTISSEFQNTALSFGFDKPVNVLNNSISNQIPAMTELKTSTVALRTGLENNYAVVGKQLARSALLGEDITSLALGIQVLRGTLGLSTEETDSFTQEIANSAKTYNTSTTMLAKSLAQFAEAIKGTLLSSAGRANVESFMEIEKRVQRFLAPGVAQAAYAPMDTGSLEQMGGAAILGISDQIQTLKSSFATTEEKTAARIEIAQIAPERAAELIDMMGSYDVAQAAYGGLLAPFGGFENIANLKQVGGALAGVEQRSPEQIRVAKIEDAIQSIGALAERFLEPIALISQSIIVMAGVLGPLSKYFINGGLVIAFGTAIAGIIRGVKIIFTRIPGILDQSLITLRSILATLRSQTAASMTTGVVGGGKTFREKTSQKLRIASKKAARAGQTISAAGKAGVLAKSLGGLALGFLGGVPGVIITLLSFLPAILASGEDTEKNTDEIAKNSRKDLPDSVSRGQDALSKQASLLAELSKQTTRSQILIASADKDDTANLLAQQRLTRLGQVVDGLNKLTDIRMKTPDILQRNNR